MKKENDELFDLFRSRLDHAELNVRDNFWEQLERDIPVVLHNRKRLFIQRIAAAASVLLILAGASAAFWVLSPKDEIAEAFTQVAVSTSSKGRIKNDGIKEELPSIHEASARPQKTKSSPALNQSVTGGTEEEFSFSFSMSFSFTEESGIPNNHPNPYKLVGGAEKTQEETLQEEQPATTPAIPAKKKKDRTWAVSAFASANPVTAKTTSNSLQMLSDRDNPLNIINPSSDVTRDDFATDADYENYMKIAEAIAQENRFTNVKHKLPISLGITLRKELSNRFSLETGLVYTQLNSELTGGQDNYYRQEQKLHYVGIPVKANFTLYDDNAFEAYASAGGMIEKCVSGSLITDYFENNQKTYSSKHSLKADPLQFSLIASVGVQYKFNDRLSVYAEPGLSYYFDDGTAINTIRKEKPFNFNLLCGVRMTY
ncbi:PorT family protein [Bacteroides sp. OttesenSCG-928-E20]|nr:PorT family protein [Bacteroides sp. OttesenSCG-928-N06]MDL2299516.1 PorT family protein [Bacteroides sp. OttesenSCG-928-E20]MDL2305741.1 PorT family protein [Bacteroides sp. OttesenSCG-928-D19]